VTVRLTLVKEAGLGAGWQALTGWAGIASLRELSGASNAHRRVEVKREVGGCGHRIQQADAAPATVIESSISQKRHCVRAYGPWSVTARHGKAEMPSVSRSLVSPETGLKSHARGGGPPGARCAKALPGAARLPPGLQGFMPCGCARYQGSLPCFAPLLRPGTLPVPRHSAHAYRRLVSPPRPGYCWPASAPVSRLRIPMRRILPISTSIPSWYPPHGQSVAGLRQRDR